MGNVVGANATRRRPGRDSEDFCADCSASLQVLCRRRRNCPVCLGYFCAVCLPSSYTVDGRIKRQRHLDEEGQRPRRSQVDFADIHCCRRCKIFSKADLSWSDLIGQETRDLLWFVDTRISSPSGPGSSRQGAVKEKEELVERILEHKRQNTEEHEARITRMANQMEELRDNERSQLPRVDSDAQTSASTSRHSSSATRAPSAVRTILFHTLTPPSSNTLPSPNAPPSTSPAPRIPATTRVTLDQLSSEEAVESLSVRQLKDLLASNFVDFKGCCERPDIVARAKRLWRSHRDNLLRMSAASQPHTSPKPPAGRPSKPWPTVSGHHDNKATSPASQEDEGGVVLGDGKQLEIEECKICMDAPVDCVFLECGHMVTCVRCGKQMNECPICRQYVVRAVRIFRS